MVDIDGVISLFGVPVEDDTGDTPRGSLHSVDGTVHFLSATAAAHLLELLTAVRARVGQRLGGAGRRTPAAAARAARRAAASELLREPGNSGAHWKLEAIERFAAGRAAGVGRRLLQRRLPPLGRAARERPTLLVATEPRDGLTARETALLRAWATALERACPRRAEWRRPRRALRPLRRLAASAAATRAGIASETAAP